ncbi:MAG TPA: hypothetical protein VK364_13405 [Hymenobacter sp.]|nr:hypothetical protein [Hymenobacter sp.]
MKKTLLGLFFLACGHDLLAQLPTNSFAVTSACSASDGNPSVLQKVNTDGSLTPVGTVTDGTTPLIINARPTRRLVLPTHSAARLGQYCPRHADLERHLVT